MGGKGNQRGGNKFQKRIQSNLLGTDLWIERRTSAALGKIVRGQKTQKKVRRKLTRLRGVRAEQK